MSFHSLYVQRRQPGVPYREFQRLWRSHGDFAATLPAFWRNVERYIHNDPVEDIAGLPNLDPTYDAVGELYYSSVEAWLAMRDVMWNEVAPDEKRVFAGPPLSVRGTREMCQVPTGAYKLITLAKFKATVDIKQREPMLSAHTDTLLASRDFGTALCGFTVTTALRPPDGAGMDRVPQTASSHDVALIAHFVNEAAAQAALRTAGYAKLQSSEAEFLDWDSRLALLCRGWILKGELG